MGENGEFWRLAQDLMESESEANGNDEWGGHAWPVVAVENYSGWSITGLGEKNNLTFSFVESTAYGHDWSDLGINPWHEIKDEAFFDVEE